MVRLLASLLLGNCGYQTDKEKNSQVEFSSLAKSPARSTRDAKSDKIRSLALHWTSHFYYGYLSTSEDRQYRKKNTNNSKLFAEAWKQEKNNSFLFVSFSKRGDENKQGLFLNNKN